MNALMSDRILIERQGPLSGTTLDRSTLAVTEPGWELVYDDTTDAQHVAVPGSGGACIVKSVAGVFGDEGTNPEEVSTYQVLLPAAAAVPQPGDRGTIMSSVRDPGLVRVQLWITAIDRNTFLVARVLHALEYEAARLRFAGGNG